MSGWSCEERKKSRCRNPFGCHCREIESLQVRLADRSAREERIRREAVKEYIPGYFVRADYAAECAFVMSIAAQVVDDHRGERFEVAEILLDYACGAELEETLCGITEGTSLAERVLASLRARQPEPQRQEGGV